MNRMSNQYGVIGDPIDHSLSPIIHNYLYTLLGLPLHYHSFHVHSKDLAGFIEKCRIESCSGFNVTIPHKESIIPLLDHLDPLAQQIGAVNTVFKRDDKLVGTNTDVFGFRMALKNSGCRARGKGILLGAGGAARAAVFALSASGLNECIVFDIQQERTERLVHDIQEKIERMILNTVTNWDDLVIHFKDAQLLVNATPVGMWPDISKCPIPDKELLIPTMTVFDMVPNPLNTSLLRMAKAQQLTTIPGIHMLVAQALAAQEIWLDRQLFKLYFDTLLTNTMRKINNNE